MHCNGFPAASSNLVQSNVSDIGAMGSQIA